MAVSVANNVDAEVPHFTNIFGYYDNYDNSDRYDGVLALSDDGNVYSIGPAYWRLQSIRQWFH